LHDGRLFVNTWPNGFGSGDVAGLWMSPEIPVGGLTTAHLNQWVKVFAYDEYEPDALIARTYGGGALHSYQGDLYWGTMHVPFLATAAHLSFYGPDYDAASIPPPVAAISAALGSQRSVSIFKGRDFDTAAPQIEVAYGMPQLPAFDPATLTWSLTDTLLGPPLYGLSGFNNMYNNYTWSMAEYDGQLFVGTMDWSYLVNDIFESLLSGLELPLDIVITLPDSVPGADLYRFFDSASPAVAESLTGVGNYSSYGIRNMLTREEGLYLGMANPMNLLTDLTDDKPEGGWELLRLTRHLIPLTVGLEGNGSGIVSSAPAGINCGVDCAEDFDFGSTVALTPTAATDSVFEGWAGACQGSGICEVTLNESAHVTATFAKSRHPLIVNLAGGGSGLVSSTPAGIACSQPSCSANFDIGTEVSLNAIAFSGSSFGAWSGACSGSDPCQVTIGPGTTVVTATFEPNPQQANLQVSGALRVGSQLNFTATLTLNPIDQCTWDFGDGTTEACDLPAVASGTDALHDVTIQTTHTYTQAGVYIVIVTASNGAGTAVAAQQITIQAPTAEEPTEQPRATELYFPFVNRD
jgi:hypothetical protein